MCRSEIQRSNLTGFPASEKGACFHGNQSWTSGRSTLADDPGSRPELWRTLALGHSILHTEYVFPRDSWRKLTLGWTAPGH
jgi:hypothetical protein